MLAANPEPPGMIVRPEELMAHRSATFAILTGIGPTDVIEGMLAAQMSAIHSAAMESFRRAAGYGQKEREHELKNALKLTNIFTHQIAALDKHRGKGQQSVTVKHVHVEAGGQAVVGNVQTTQRKRARKVSKAVPAALTHEPVVDLVGLGSLEKAPAAAKVR
jgi:hypothetical protein